MIQFQSLLSWICLSDPEVEIGSVSGSVTGFQSLLSWICLSDTVAVAVPLWLGHWVSILVVVDLSF